MNFKVWYCGVHYPVFLFNKICSQWVYLGNIIIIIIIFGYQFSTNALSEDADWLVEEKEGIERD